MRQHRGAQALRCPAPPRASPSAEPRRPLPFGQALSAQAALPDPSRSGEAPPPRAVTEITRRSARAVGGPGLGQPAPCHGPRKTEALAVQRAALAGAGPRGEARKLGLAAAPLSEAASLPLGSDLTSRLRRPSLWGRSRSFLLSPPGSSRPFAPSGEQARRGDGRPAGTGLGQPLAAKSAQLLQAGPGAQVRPYSLAPNLSSRWAELSQNPSPNTRSTDCFQFHFSLWAPVPAASPSWKLGTAEPGSTVTHAGLLFGHRLLPPSQTSPPAEPVYNHGFTKSFCRLLSCQAPRAPASRGWHGGSLAWGDGSRHCLSPWFKDFLTRRRGGLEQAGRPAGTELGVHSTAGFTVRSRAAATSFLSAASPVQCPVAGQ